MVAVVESWPSGVEEHGECGSGRRPSRVRVLAAVLLLTAMGLLVAASVFASRPYIPAGHPAGDRERASHHNQNASDPDPC